MSCCDVLDFKAGRIPMPDAFLFLISGNPFEVSLLPLFLIIGAESIARGLLLVFAGIIRVFTS
jgi:hypothetical protein